MEQALEKSFRIEEWLYLLYVATISFAIFPEITVRGQSIQISDIVFLFVIAAWFFSIISGKRILRFSWFYGCLGLYAAACICSTLVSANLSHSAVKLAGKVYLISIAVVTFNLITTAGFLKKTSIAWLVGTCITLFFSLFGIILFFIGLKNPSINLVVHPIFGSLPVGNYPRIQGFFEYPAMLSNYLSVSWMIAIYSISFGWLRHRVFRPFTVSIWIVNLFTFTPGLGGFIFGTGYFLQKKLKEAGKILLGKSLLSLSIMAALGFLFIASITFFAYSPEGTKMPLLSGKIIPSHRAMAWNSAFDTFVQNPVFGRGIGAPVATSRFTTPSGHHLLLTDAHNTYLSVLGETGLIGFLTFACIIGFIILTLKSWQPTDANMKTLRLCLVIALIDAFFYQSLTGSYEDTRHLWILFGLMVAVTASDFRLFEYVSGQDSKSIDQ